MQLSEKGVLVAGQQGTGQPVIAILQVLPGHLT